MKVRMWGFNFGLGHVNVSRVTLPLKTWVYKYAMLTLSLSAHVPGTILDVVYTEGIKQSACTHGAYILLGVEK